MKPIIGVSSALSKETFHDTNVTSDFHYAAVSYTDAIYSAGGIPFIISPDNFNDSYDEKIAEIIENIDGLLLTGGGDVGINNSTTIKSKLIEQQRQRYGFESSLLVEAWRKNLSVMGICRGHQMIVEVLGGSILPEFIEGHTNKSDSGSIQHRIKIVAGSKLSHIIKTNEWMVNSYHRQAAYEIPDCLKVSAVSEDGIIEAVESKNKNFFMGFQFHPELLLPEDEKANEIFRAFINSTVKKS